MRTPIIAGIVTVLVLVLATFFWSSDEEPQPTTDDSQSTIVEVVDAPSREEQKETWSKIAFSKLTTAHQLYLNHEEQLIYQASVVKFLEAHDKFKRTGLAEAKDDALRFSAEVDRWDKLVEDAQRDE